MKQHPYLPPSSSGAPKILGLFILLVFVFALGWHVGLTQGGRQNDLMPAGSSTSSGNQQSMDIPLFWDVWGLLAAKYVDPTALDFKTMAYGAIRGMVDSLDDPYTNFMTPKENKEFQESLDGTLEGIGAELTLRNGLITVVSPLKGSPAKAAGLQPEDVILKINGEELKDAKLEEVVTKIRGPRGTKLTLTVIHKGDNKPVDLSIVRQSINVSSTEWKMIDGIAHVELNQFGSNTIDEFNKAVNDILVKNPKGIVLDLRYNGGGYLDGAVDIVSTFLDKGEVISVKKRNPSEDEVIYVTGKARITKIPLVVLINKGSASASEIVAGALRDNHRAILIGETTFGKGTVQELENLSDGSSLRVTIARWFTPNKVNISEVGIKPDIEVKRTLDDIKASRDPQLDAALDYLKKH